MRTQDRRLGMFWGLAIGDALGACVEFAPRGSFPPVSGYRGGGPFKLRAGEWTDDTSMALALADSLLSKGWDLHDQAQRYLCWRDLGHYSVNGRCFDIGITTDRALSRFAETQNPHPSAPDDEWSAGTGSIMRLAPVPAAYFELRRQDPQAFITYCMQSSKVTHAAPLCLAACGWMGLALCDLALGESLGHILAPTWRGLKEISSVLTWPKALADALGPHLLNCSVHQIESSGYVVHSLQAAVWALAQASDFKDALLRAVNLGGDADTIGAITGQLAGATFGLSAIPGDLKSGLAQAERIHEVAESLVKTALPGT
jgi:ADP-ribosyl-[dinitrogen reductase] hydrolase